MEGRSPRTIRRYNRYGYECVHRVQVCSFLAEATTLTPEAIPFRVTTSTVCHKKYTIKYHTAVH